MISFPFFFAIFTNQGSYGTSLNTRGAQQMQTSFLDQNISCFTLVTPRKNVQVLYQAAHEYTTDKWNLCVEPIAIVFTIGISM